MSNLIYSFCERTSFAHKVVKNHDFMCKAERTDRALAWVCGVDYSPEEEYSLTIVVFDVMFWLAAPIIFIIAFLSKVKFKKSKGV